MKENKSFFGKFITVHPAVIAVWAAVVAAGYLIPTFPVFGTGAHFTAANALNPLSGIFFGPVTGALCSLIGGFIGLLIAPVKPMLGPLSCVIAMITAFTTGCIAWGKLPPVNMNENGNFVFNGGIIVYIVGTILWFTQEIGRSVIHIPVFFYGIGFAAFVLGIIFSEKFFSGKKKLLILLAIWICSFGGLIGGASVGNYFSLVFLKVPKDAWLTIILFLAPLERAVFAFAAALVGTSLIIGLNKIGIFVGPQKANQENKQEEKNED